MAKDSNRLICEYLKTERQEQLSEELRREMNRSKQLSEELAFYGELREAIADGDLISFREQIGRVFHKKQRKGLPDVMQHHRKRLVLAGFGVVMLIAAVVWMTYRPVTPKTLFDQYYTSYPGMPVVRSGASQEAGLMGQAFRHYNHEEWEASARCFRQLVDQGKNSSLAVFYLGLVNLELGDEQEALEHFDATIRQDQNLFKPQAYWFSSLAYLKADNEEEALSRLSRIVEQDMWHAEQARKIIRQLR
jgi:tetratricopeptide (TPR) repeat protein